MSRITLAGPGGTIRLARSGASWRLDAPVRMRAGEAQVRQLISSLAGASVRRFIDDPAASAAAPANAEQARLTIVCETDERALDGDAVRTVTRSRTLHIGAPADVEQTTWFARTGDGQALVVEASIAILSLDPSVYAAATAAATRPEDVGTVIIRPATGAERGFRRGISGWSRMAPDGSLAEVDGAPIEDLLVFLSQRVAPRVRFEAPAGLEPIATITLLDFASGPLETVGVFRTPEGAACELRPIGAESPVYLVYPGADAPGLLIGSP